MFNYYTYEKLLKEYIQQGKREEKEAKITKARQKQNKQLIVNYNRRINKFVLEMIKNPVKIKDYSSFAQCERLELRDDIPKNMKNKKQFIFNKFITDKERINAYLEEQKRHHAFFEKMKPKKLQNNYSKGFRDNTEKNKQVCYTPSMIAKNKYYIDDNNCNNNKSHCLLNKSESELLFSSNTPKNKIINDYHHVKLNPYYIKKNDKMRLNRNTSASSSVFMKCKDRHIKTHFKAATAIAEGFNSQWNIDDDLNKKNSLSKNVSMRLFSPKQKFTIMGKADQKKRVFSSQTILKHKEKQLLQDNIKDSSLEQFKLKFPVKEENVDLINANPLLFNLKYNDSTNKYSNFNEDDNDHDHDLHENKMSYLLYLATKDQIPKVIHNNNSLNCDDLIEKIRRAGKKKNVIKANCKLSFQEEDDDFKQGNFSDFNRDDKIWYQNELVPLTKMDYLASKVLKNCNYINKKSKYNDSSLKKGNGKLMITSGLTVNDFEKKFNIN